MALNWAIKVNKGEDILLANSVTMDTYHMSYEEIMACVKFVKPLGKGSFGEASLVMYWGQLACMKKSDIMDRVELYQAEARVMCAVSGAGGAPRLLAVGSDRPILIMDYCEGTTLREFCKSPAAADRSLLYAVTADLVLKLQEIHDCGYCHNDVTPANVLVSNSGGHYTTHIIDFGLAKPLTLRNAELDIKDALQTISRLTFPDVMLNLRTITDAAFPNYPTDDSLTAVPVARILADLENLQYFHWFPA